MWTNRWSGASARTGRGGSGSTPSHTARRRASTVWLLSPRMRSTYIHNCQSVERKSKYTIEYRKGKVAPVWRGTRAPQAAPQACAARSSAGVAPQPATGPRTPPALILPSPLSPAPNSPLRQQCLRAQREAAKQGQRGRSAYRSMLATLELLQSFGHECLGNRANRRHIDLGLGSLV